MREVKKRLDRFDPARMEKIEAMINRLEKYRIMFDGEDRELIQEALEVHKNMIALFEGGNK